MKYNRPISVQNVNKRPPLPQKGGNKFVYSKQKFSSPEFFFKNSIPIVNRNLLSGMLSPQPKRNYEKIQNESRRGMNSQDKNKDLKTKKDLGETYKINIKNQVTKNDSFYPIETKRQKQNHHNFQKLQSHPNQQNLYEKRSYLKHKRVESEPADLKRLQNVKKQINEKKEVHFNDSKIKANIATLKRQVRKRLQGSTSSSILKNKNRKGRITSIDCLPIKREQNNEDSVSIVSVEMKECLLSKQTKANLIVRKKYENIINNLRNKFTQNRISVNIGIDLTQIYKQIQKIKNVKQSDKFTDSLFPANNSSLFGYWNLVPKKQGDLKRKQIKWLRIKQLFPLNQIILFDQNSQNKSQISILPSVYGSVQLVTAFNAIKNCKPLLTKIFQTQKVNQLGIYILKIFQQNIWKYVIIDDKIPVVQKSILTPKSNRRKPNQQNQQGHSEYVPAFLNLQTKKNVKQLQVWPLLLQKAYANFYSSYQTFHLGNEVDYLQQLTGTPGLFLDFKQTTEANESINQLQVQLKVHSAFGLGQKNQEVRSFPLLQNRFKDSNLKSLIYYNPTNGFNEFCLPYEKVPSLFDRIHVFEIKKYSHLSSCIIGQYQHIHKENKNTQRAEYSVRHFDLKQNSEVVLSIRQKQKRFYENSSFKYDYMWIRIMLIQREFNGQYRWVAGKYSNQKSINLPSYLTAGNYFVIVMPQWRETHCHQLNLFLWSNIKNVEIQRVNYNPSQKIIQKACMDLAQRKGRLSQVNAFICSYNYLNEDVGMIIENINNERTIGTVKVMRSINGLKASVEIVPINKEFYQISEQEQRKQRKKFKNNITISIPQQQSFTVVLKMKNGIDKKFFQVFDFGN